MRTGRRRARRDSRCAHVAPHVTSRATCETALRDVRSVGSEGGKPKGGGVRLRRTLVRHGEVCAVALWRRARPCAHAKRPRLAGIDRAEQRSCRAAAMPAVARRATMVLLHVAHDEAQPSTRTNHVLRCACFIILPSSDACPVGMCSRRRHTHSHRVRVRSWQLWSTSPLAPCCSCLAAGCRWLHCFTGGAGCAHASGCGKPQLRMPSHVKRATIAPFFVPHHSDSRYACMALEHGAPTVLSRCTVPGRR